MVSGIVRNSGCHWLHVTARHNCTCQKWKDNIYWWQFSVMLTLMAFCTQLARFPSKRRIGQHTKSQKCKTNEMTALCHVWGYLSRDPIRASNLCPPRKGTSPDATFSRPKGGSPHGVPLIFIVPGSQGFRKICCVAHAEQGGRAGNLYVCPQWDTLQQEGNGPMTCIDN